MLCYTYIGFKCILRAREKLWISIICALLFTSAGSFGVYQNFYFLYIEHYKQTNEYRSDYLRISMLFWGLLFLTYGLGHYLFACNYYSCSIWLRKVAMRDQVAAKCHEKAVYVVLLVLNIIVPSYVSWMEFAFDRRTLMIVLGVSYTLEITTCAILAVALYKINKIMLEFQNIGMSMTKLLVHLGSFVIFLLSYTLTYFWELYRYYKPSEYSREDITFWITVF
jgi:hypothetical protein